MANNETVAEILHMMRDARNLDPSAIEDRNHLLSDWYYDDECQGWLSSYADRIEAAHKREMNHRALIAGVSLADAVDDAHKRELAAKDGERKGLLRANESLANDNTRLRGELAAKDAEIAELRESLKEAVNNECNYCRTVRKDGTYGKCEHLRADGKCDHLHGVNCIVHKWRKALEGVRNETK